MHAQLTTAPRTIAGIFPHPDDETYAAAGTLALCARAGARVLLACATRGERGARFDADAPSAAMPLAGVRAAELARSCAQIGAQAPVFFDAPDGAVGAHRDQLATAVGAWLHDSAPDVVVTLGDDGAYGHADHLACTAAVRDAVTAMSAPPRLLHVQFPRDVFAPVRRALRRAGPAVIPPGSPPLGIGRDRAELIVDIGAVADVKLASLAAHRSQLPGGDPRAFLLHGFIDQLLAEEWFTVAAGRALPRGARDPFAGL